MCPSTADGACADATGQGQPASQVSCGEASRGRQGSNATSRSLDFAPLCGRAARAPEHDARLALIVTESPPRTTLLARSMLSLDEVRQRGKCGLPDR